MQMIVRIKVLVWKRGLMIVKEWIGRVLVMEVVVVLMEKAKEKRMTISFVREM